MLDGQHLDGEGGAVTPQWRTQCWAVWCLGAALTTGAGCGTPLCPGATFPAQISVRLADDWPTETDLTITVSCPPGEECGFLDGPITGKASGNLMVVTVLRPPAVDVAVRSVSTGALLREQRLEVSYEPLGPRQTRCGGESQSLLVVPAG